MQAINLIQYSAKTGKHYCFEGNILPYYLKIDTCNMSPNWDGANKSLYLLTKRLSPSEFKMLWHSRLHV